MRNLSHRCKCVISCINRPTRITHTSATIIDNIYLNANYYKDCCSGIIITDLSGHYPIIACVGTKQQHCKTTSISFKRRKLNEAAYNKLNELLYQVNWDILHSLDIHSTYKKFLDIVSDLLDVVSPEKTITIKRHQSTCNTCT